jgi:hypothetical protein
MSSRGRNQRVDDFADESGVVLLRIEPADVYDPAIIAIAERSGSHFLVYDREKVIAQAVAHEEMDYETAIEWHEFNTFCAWLGDGTPAFADLTSSG